MNEPVHIDVVSDVMCPWCLIGKRRLEAALAMIDRDVAIRWRPFQLDPTLPAQGRDRREYLEAKFGGPERARAVYERIAEAGREEGIEFAFDRIAVSSNTLDAHRVIRWAASAGDGVQGKVVEALFLAFFIEGRVLGSHDVLVDVAGRCGMDAELVRELLRSDRDVAEVKAEIASAQAMGATGVPCFIVGGRYALMGAEPADRLAEAIRKAA